MRKTDFLRASPPSSGSSIGSSIIDWRKKTFPRQALHNIFSKPCIRSGAITPATKPRRMPLLAAVVPVTMNVCYFTFDECVRDIHIFSVQLTQILSILSNFKSSMSEPTIFLRTYKYTIALFLSNFVRFGTVECILVG